MKRNSSDSKINSIGLKLLEICKRNNLFIANGRIGEDRQIGKCTFRETSVIDYALITFNCYIHSFLIFKFLK